MFIGFWSLVRLVGERIFCHEFGLGIYLSVTENSEQDRRMANYFNNILETIGNTPIVRINNLAQTAAPNTTILCMLPDTGERYLSTPLFEGIPFIEPGDLGGKDPYELLPNWLHKR
jgi:hypothetical protein